MRWLAGAALLCGCVASVAAASQIVPLPLQELESRSTFVVTGKVTAVVEQGLEDKVTIAVASYIKGKSDAKEFTFSIVTRGGVKNFDEPLKVGDSGVFFLRKLDESGAVWRTFHSGYALFPRPDYLPLKEGK